MNCGKLLYLEEDFGIVYRQGNLYICDGKGCVQQQICKLPFSRPKRFFSKIRWVERLLRLEPHCCERVGAQEFVITHHGFIYRFSLLDGSIVKEHAFRAGMNNPLSILKFKQSLYYGEYFGNTGEPVNIFKREPNGAWHLVYTFPAHTINHIHNIIHDAVRHRFIVLTGDSDQECGFYVADEEFKEVFPLLTGSQKVRSCQTFVTENGILYATDTPLEQNHIYFMNHDGGDLRLICDIDGPCIYGAKVNDQFYLSTTVEPDSNLHSIAYLLTYRRGAGVKTEYSKLYCGDESGFREIAAYQKDFLPMAAFGFGALTFPNMKGGTQIFVNGISLKKIDNRYDKKGECCEL